MRLMSYESARNEIRNGDIIHVYSPPFKHWQGLQGIIHPLIFFFTGSRIYHNVVAVWMTAPSGEFRLMAVESNIKGGKRVVPLSMYAAHRLVVHPLPAQYSFEKMEPKLMARVGKQNYGLTDFLLIGLKEFFGVNPKKDFKGQVCSELCAEAWISAGAPLLDTLVSPGRLYNDILYIGVQPTICTEATFE